MPEHGEREPLTQQPFAGLAELVSAGGWVAPADVVDTATARLAEGLDVPLPLIQVERGGLTWPRPGEPLTPEQQARYDRMTRWEQERWAEDWLTWPVLDGLSWYCARCRFTGPRGEHAGCAGQLERVRVTVTRYFPPEDEDE